MTEFAYPVPGRFLRERAPVYGLRNTGRETLHTVAVALDGPGLLAARAPRSLRPGETAWLPIRGDDLARATTLLVRWRRENDEEYLWRVAF